MLSKTILRTGAALVAGTLVACGGVGSASADVGPPHALQDPRSSCEALRHRSDASTVVSDVSYHGLGDLSVSPQLVVKDLPAFCRLAVSLKPTSESDIRVEVWMPGKSWNGRFLGVGSGGYAGIIDYASLAAGLKRGYAVAHTDMGTAPSNSLDGTPLIGHPEKWVDWGHRSTHLMTAFAKSSLKAFYQSSPRKAYFIGCSTGGGQAIHEVTRYPEDYDGVIVGAPANDRVGTHIGIASYWANLATLPGGSLEPHKVELVASAAKAACDGDDGVVDGLISRPEQCNFKPSSLLCKAGDSSKCLTSEEVSAVEKMYSPVMNPSTGAIIAPGQAFGSESQWPTWGPPRFSVAPFNAIFQWVFGRDVDLLKFDYASDTERLVRTLGPIVNATNADLSAFKERGGKLIAFNGLSDTALPPDGLQRYLDRVAAATNGASSFVRFFKAPGLNHCWGGVGPNAFGQHLALASPYPGDPARDLLAALEKWVEGGNAPERIVATKFKNDDMAAKEVLMTRPLCAHPKVVVYKGTGNTNNEQSFVCADPR